MNILGALTFLVDLGAESPCLRALLTEVTHRRHQLNHSAQALKCDVPGCDKTFHRTDLLSRHREEQYELVISDTKA